MTAKQEIEQVVSLCDEITDKSCAWSDKKVDASVIAFAMAIHLARIRQAAKRALEQFEKAEKKLEKL